MVSPRVSDFAVLDLEQEGAAVVTVLLPFSLWRCVSPFNEVGFAVGILAVLAVWVFRFVTLGGYTVMGCNCDRFSSTDGIVDVILLSFVVTTGIVGTTSGTRGAGIDFGLVWLVMSPLGLCTALVPIVYLVEALCVFVVGRAVFVVVVDGCAMGAVFGTTTVL
jgi:hypothetical protein